MDIDIFFSMTCENDLMSENWNILIFSLFSLHLYLSAVVPLKISSRSVSWFLTTRTTMVRLWERDTPVLPWAALETAAYHPSTTRPTMSPATNITTTTTSPSRMSLTVTLWQVQLPISDIPNVQAMIHRFNLNLQWQALVTISWDREHYLTVMSSIARIEIDLSDEKSLSI